MFVNLKTNKPAFLIEHDADAVYSLDQADAGKPHHTVTSAEFFATHREATAEEISDFYGTPKGPPAATAPARSPAAAKGARKGQPSKPRAIGASAPSPVLRLRGGGRGGAGRAGGEPHGE